MLWGVVRVWASEPETFDFVDSPWLVENRDLDDDGDGLSNHEETHKYFTDPHREDSDSDGFPDGHWDERREFAYTVRNVMEILEPFDLAAMHSDVQDARLVRTGERTSVVEVVYYPYNTNAEAPPGSSDVAVGPQYLAPSRTVDWTEDMRAELLSALLADGIDAMALPERERVERVSKWVIGEAFPNHAPFVAYVTDFSGEPRLADGFLPLFAMDHPTLPAADRAAVIRSGTSGATMFRNRARGSCTPSAILMATVMRALGIPTRLVLTVPIIDPNDAEQRRSLDDLRDRYIRYFVKKETGEMRGWVGHAFNEVYVDGRWLKLNYDQLGQNNLDANYLGMMTQVNTMVDWADAGLTDTWGRRVVDAVERKLDPPMSSVNQYRSLALSDAVGVHADPERARPPIVVGLDSFSPDVSNFGGPGERRATVNWVRWSDDPETGRGIALGVNGDVSALATFVKRGSDRFTLVADGAPPVPARALPDVITTLRSGCVLVRIEDPSALRSGARYRLVPKDASRWVVPEDLWLVAP
jgi:hypothetical protein